MKEQTKKLYTIVVIVLVAVAAYAAAGLMQVDLPEEPVRISVVLENSSSDRWKSFMSGVEQASDDLSVSLSTVPTSYYTSEEDEALYIQAEEQSGADAVITGVDPDPTEVAELLFSRIESDYGNELSGLTVAFLAGSKYDDFNTALLDELESRIVRRGGEVFWKKNAPYNVERLLRRSKRTDIVIALDDDSLSKAAAYLNKKKGQDRRLYGVGCSSTCAYYLDREVISAMVAGDGFTAGYESLEAAAKGWDYTTVIPEARLILPEDVYSEENEKLLFP